MNRQEIYDNATQLVDNLGEEWRGDHSFIVNRQYTFGYWDDWKQTMMGKPHPSYEFRRLAFHHIRSVSPKLVIELLDEIEMLRERIAVLEVMNSLAEVKTNET